MTITREIRHGHLFCGAGGGAKGFNKSKPSIGVMIGKMRCVGGIDNDPAGIADFERESGVKGTLMDLADSRQYEAFHGREPPSEWREATTADIHRAFGWEHPHILFLSAPCKGFSGLMPNSKSMTAKYQALNELTLRGIWLTLEAYKDDPVELILFENVPLIATRGRHLLDQIVQLLRSYGYEVAETTHDCGELGGLPQSRRRFLLVARHAAKVPPFVYEPVKRRLRSVGEVLERMPLPGDIERAGPMHRIPSLQWKTWVRLAFVEAGSDWRSLNRLAVEDGHLRDYLVMPDARHGYLGVQNWQDTSGTVTSRGGPTNGSFSIADPRPPAGAAQYQQFGVMHMSDTAGAVIGVKSPGQGTFSVADPRHAGPAKHSNEYRIVPWAGPAGAVTSAHGSGQCVQDPRGGIDPDLLHGKYHVTPWGEHSRTVIAGNANGAFSVADPRPGLRREKGDSYLTAGHYGVIDWTQSAGAVSGSACHDNGRWTVADPRALECSTHEPPTDVDSLGKAESGTSPILQGAENVPALPKATDKVICRIHALDGTWHRPFTTLELAALQSYYDPDDDFERRQLMGHFKMDGENDQAWRERIGNMVPPDAAEAIGEVFGQALLLAWSGETFVLGSTPIWVRDVAVALSVQGGHA
ncbi:C-5 cytosine-specific DNA methylase [Comamonas sp. BIGb0124]|uniref:DNA cytosine methyltransferase n=1 Tax=Comamonas sp. BIGb0124 TaxID=2485130 RepID=UPI000F49C6AB|nr:DNA cytosine methyltransferase [Comamonas sp. BIGb0124]ROR25135.1 C-5 cytosine-specific DNA methylase [Comamonas sp. BIGb0124]